MDPLHAVALILALAVITACASAEVRAFVGLMVSLGRALFVRR